jgi:CBS domain-containing protein
MICPSCATPNLPGAEECVWCQFALAAIDRSMAGTHVEGHLLNDCVSQICPRVLQTVPVEATLGAAIARMVGQTVGAVLVTGKSGELVGILTERDFLTRVAGAADFAQRRVRDYMTRDPETVGFTDPLAVALAKMDLGGYRHLPVLEDGKPVGMVSMRDVLKHLLKLCQEFE